MRGRKPIPAAIRRLTGGGSSQPKAPTLILPKALPAPPWELSKAARAEWDRLAPQLFAAGVLTELDAQAVAAWAETLVKYHEANRALARHGILVDGASGGLAVNPAQRVAKDCLAAMQRFQAEFGATPSARMRVTAQPAPPEMDAFDKFLAERPD